MDYFTRPNKNLRPEDSRVQPWFAIDGDKNLRVDYDLKPSSTVFDIGGYKARWSREIYKKYRCHIEIFEPVSSFVKIIEKEFMNNKKVGVHRFGLGGKTEEVEISLDHASSSTFKAKGEKEKIKLVAVSDFIKENCPKSMIDLMKINIEGGEYALLDDLTKSGLIKNIKDIQVQFHIFVPDAVIKRKQAQRRLSKTHYLTYSYP